MVIKSDMYINGNKCKYYEKDRRRAFFLLENNIVISRKKVQKIVVKCSECHKLSEIGFRIYYVNNKYRCQHCKLSGENNPFYGKKHTEEFKKRLSKDRKGIYGVGKKNPMYGIDVKTLMSDDKIQEWKRKISMATKGKKNPMYGKTVESIVGKERWHEISQKIKNTINNMPEEKRKIWSEKQKIGIQRYKEKYPDKYREAKSRGGLAARKSSKSYKMNRFEKKIEDWLILHKIDYTFSPIINYKKKNYQFDFIVHKKQILIECNGTYWHAHPDYYNIDGSEGKRKMNLTQIMKCKADIIKEEVAKYYNFKLISVWECDIKNNDYTKLEEIL